MALEKVEDFIVDERDEGKIIWAWAEFELACTPWTWDEKESILNCWRRGGYKNGDGLKNTILPEGWC